MTKVEMLKKAGDELKRKINTSTAQEQKGQNLGRDFILNQRATKEAERAEKDKLYGNNPNYKREIFAWEKTPELKTPGTTQTGTTQPRTTQSVANELAEASRQKQLSNLKSAFDKQMATQRQELSRVPTLFREQRGNVRTAGTMAQTGLEKRAATQGLSGSGALTQGTIAQNVTTQGQLGRLGQQEAQVKADIQARMAQLQNDFDRGVANIDSEIEMTRLQDEMARLEKQEAESKALQDKTFQRELSTIGQYSQDYQAEINRREAINPNDPLIPYLKAARQEKIAGIEQQDFQTELANIGQYSQDYQAEINRREAINPNDPLLPYLRNARQQKIAGIEAGQAEQARIQEERDYELFLRDLDVQDKATLMQYENELEQSNKLLDAEIQSIRDEQKFVQDSALKTQLFEQEQILMDRKAQNDRYLQAIKDSSAMDRILASDQAAKEQIVLREELKGIYDATEGGLPLDVIYESIDNSISSISNPELDSLREQYLALEDDENASLIANQIKMLVDQGPDARDVKTNIMVTLLNNKDWFAGAGGKQKLMTVLATNGISPEEFSKFEDTIEFETTGNPLY